MLIHFFRCSTSALCVGYRLDPLLNKQCSLLYHTTDYTSSLNSLNISSEVTTLIRDDFHLARIEKKLCDKVRVLPNLAVNGYASQSSDYGESICPCPASLAIDRNPSHGVSHGTCSMTNNDYNNSWWLLDMQKEQDVEIVRLTNGDASNQQMSNFEIRVGMNSTDFSQNALCFNMSGVAPSRETTNFPCVNVVRGRYVSIQRYFPYDVLGKGLQICEVQIIPPIPDTSMFNIAPYGTASQSSTSSFASASMAIDGFSHSDWNKLSCTHTYNQLGWWKLDMKQTTTVTLVRLTNRDLAPDRLSNFEIRIGFDETDFSKNSLCYYMPGIVSNAGTEDFPCLKPTRGRYLTIQRIYPLGPSGHKILTICEVEVFQTGC